MNRPVLRSIVTLAVTLLLLTVGLYLTRGAGGGDFFMPHAHCYLFNGDLMRLHGGSDFLIGASYVSISATLVWLVYRARKNLPFHWMMLAFAIFIVACGATHFMELWTLTAEHPRYWLSGWVKVVTAIASVTTAMVLPPLVPRILELMESARSQYAAIVTSSGDAIVSKTLDGVVTSWNAGAERLFGWSAEEMIGRPIFRIVPAGRQDEENDFLRRLRGGERIEHFETVRVAKDGRSIPMSVTISPVRDANGVVVGASKIARDITERKQTEGELRAARDAAESANRAKDEFLAALSHELRTPLTPVLMLATEMEQSGVLPENVRSDFAMIRKNVELEARIIDDLLDLTRITHGKLMLSFERVEVHGLITHALTILRGDSEAKQISVALELAATGHHVSADAVRLQQVFWNVVKNAIKFTPHGGRIAIRSWNEPGHSRVAIADNGMGITTEEMPRIFTAFAQGSEAAGPRFGGLGLGLSITALLVREHRGRIWAESAGRDQGATFHLEFPLATAPAPDQPATPVTPPAAEGSLRILLVEDHEDTRAILQRLMTRWGHKITTAASVAQAVDAIAGGDCDLLLSDVGLPDGSGYDVIAALRKKSDVPAVAMSGYGMEADLARTHAAGFAEHIVKPISSERLRELLARFSAAAPLR